MSEKRQEAIQAVVGMNNEKAAWIIIAAHVAQKQTLQQFEEFQRLVLSRELSLAEAVVKYGINIDLAQVYTAVGARVAPIP